MNRVWAGDKPNELIKQRPRQGNLFDTVDTVAFGGIANEKEIVPPTKRPDYEARLEQERAEQADSAYWDR